MTEGWQIAVDDLSTADIRGLLQQHFDAMLANSPPGSCHFLNFDELKGADVSFWSIREHGHLAGCGALRQIDSRHGEIKSMRTVDAFQRRGVAAHMLDHILSIARSRGYRRLSLETGSGESFASAISLYRRFGFVDCAPFGEYQEDVFSRFMSRSI